ncbi:MAG: hypothetical protein WC538_21225 [Thermoanaerobaculia bacterium]
MKRATFATMIWTLAVVMTLSARGARAQGRGETPCTLKTLQGTWAITSEGTGPFGPFTAIGIEAFDGAGKTTVKETVAGNGAPMAFEFAGTYIVNDDCSGTMSADFGDGVEHALSIVITANATQFIGLQVEPGTLVRVAATKQNWPTVPPARNCRELSQ